MTWSFFKIGEDHQKENAFHRHSGFDSTVFAELMHYFLKGRLLIYTTFGDIKTDKIDTNYTGGLFSVLVD